MKSTLKIVFVIIGTLIGAGFASGQEIYQFFYSYGKKGMIGILLSAIIISITIYKTLKIVKENKTKNYQELLEKIIKKDTNKKYMNIKNIINNIVNLFTLITFFIMIAGFGTYLEEQLKINHIIGSSMLAIICFFIFKKNVQGVVKVNEAIIPLLIIFIIVIGGITIESSIANLQQLVIEEKTKWITSSALYAGYNSILLIPVLITLNEYLEKNKNNKQIINIALISGAITAILGNIIFIILTNAGEEINQIEMPVAYVISKMSTIIQTIYGIIISLSILTTAVSLGNSFLTNTIERKNIKNKNLTRHSNQRLQSGPENLVAFDNKKIISIIMCIIAVLCSNIGFSSLISYAYPIFGILGLIQFAFFIIV